MKIRFLVAVLFSATLSFPCLATDLPEETIAQKLYAVHVTRRLPQDGILHAGIGGKESLVGPIPEELFPDFRCTVHFSLGEMVRPVEGVISWEDCPFAVVTPLSEILPQTINLNCYDTFILGDYLLGEKAILVMPLSYPIPGRIPCELHLYDPLSCTLREAVDEAIAMRGGWAVRMSSDDREDELAEAWFDGMNINQPSFFASLLQMRPHIAFGCRFEPLDGEAYRFGEIENILYSIAFSYLPLNSEMANRMSRDELCELARELVEKAGALSRYVDRLPFSEKSLEVYRRNHERLLSWVNILEADIHLRTLYGRTLMQSAEELWRRIDTYRTSLEELNSFLDASWNLFPEETLNEVAA